MTDRKFTEADIEFVNEIKERLGHLKSLESLKSKLDKGDAKLTCTGATRVMEIELNIDEDLLKDALNTQIDRLQAFIDKHMEKEDD